MRVLSIDGGGMCGVIPLRFLQCLQKESKDFDLIAGTSTGGIIAIAMGFGFKVREIRDFYYQFGGDIFKRSIWDKLINPFGIRKPLYNINNLKQVLYNFWKENAFGDTQDIVKLLVPSYNVISEKPKMFKNWKDTTIPAYIVGTATAAAPVYFSGYSRYIDGGIVANNPALCAVAEAVRLGAKLEEIELLSLGTGQSRMKLKKHKHGGVLHWVSDISSVLLTGSVAAVHYQCKMLGLKKYLRLDLKLPVEYSMMDDYRPKVLEARESLVDNWMNFYVVEY